MNRRTPIDPDYATCAALCLWLEIRGCSSRLNRFHQSEFRNIAERNGLLIQSQEDCISIASIKQLTASKDLRQQLDRFLQLLDFLPRSEHCDSTFKYTIRCRWESRYGSGGPTLWPEQMKELARLRCDLVFDFAFSADLWWKALPLSTESLSETSNDPSGSDDLCCERACATLAIYPTILKVGEVTDILGCEPTEAANKGELIWNGKVASWSAWFLRTEGRVNSTTLSTHLDWLMKQIDMSQCKQDALEMDKQLKMAVLCVWWSRYGKGGPKIPFTQLSDLGNLGLEVTIDAQYFGESDD